MTRNDVEIFDHKNERGQIARKLLPDGREAGVVPQLFNAKITEGRADDDTGYSQEWSYESTGQALAALQEWDAAQETEPTSWIRHLPSNRRRVKGDPNTEYIEP